MEFEHVIGGLAEENREATSLLGGFMEIDLSALYAKTGGFIRGICHPHGFIRELKEAGINWVRMDVPYPFKDERLSDGYVRYREECRRYNADGVGVVAISPYPDAFVEAGIDASSPEGLRAVEETCWFLSRDFARMKVCWQASNELFIPHFREPLDEAQAVEFLAASIRGLKSGGPASAVGHNSVDREMTFPLEAVEEKSGSCDYIGLDLYDGTWSAGGPDTFMERIDELARRTGKPVILMEFGFSSMGAGSEDIWAEGIKWLADRGFKSAEDAVRRLDEVLRFMPPRCGERVRSCAESDKVSCLMSCMPHVLKTWPAPAPILHSEEGQAEFYGRLLPLLLKNPRLGGAVIYCMQDSESCFFCGERDCPCETAWGLLRTDGTPKPAYDAVRKSWKEI